MLDALIKVLSSNLAVLILKLISGFIFPRVMAIEEYADYQTFGLYLTYITIAQLGFATGMFVKYGGKKYDEIKANQYKSEIHCLIFILLSVSSVLVLFGSFIKNNMFIIVALLILPHGIITSFMSFYQAWGEFKKFAYVNFIVTAVPILLTAGVAIVSGKMSADDYIISFSGTHLIVLAFILYGFFVKTRGIRATKYFSEENKRILGVGATIFLGNYINVLFHSVDKQFVNMIFNKQSFAFYSFGLSMQSLMMVFITSTAQPLFSFLANGKIKKEKYNQLKQILIIFGSFSGLALFACRIVISLLVPKYLKSVSIIEIYFMAFPALAVINCLYINLYKTTGKSKQYVRRLAQVFGLSLAMNALLVSVWRDMRAITVATIIVYYTWLLLDSKRFSGLTIDKKDMSFLIFYIVIYLGCNSIPNEIIAGLVYIVAIISLSICIYKDTTFYLFGFANELRLKR